MFFLRKKYVLTGLIVEVTKKIGEQQYYGKIVGVPYFRKTFITINKKNIPMCVRDMVENCRLDYAFMGRKCASVLILPEEEKLFAYRALSLPTKILSWIGAVNWDLTRVRILHPAGFITFVLTLLCLPLTWLMWSVTVPMLLDEFIESFCLWN
jgi:hypothetical protein